MSLLNLKNDIQIPAWLKKFTLLLVSGIILYYYFRNYNWAKILRAIQSSHFTLAIISTVIPQLFFWYFEVLITERHIVWFHGPFSFKEFLWARGAIYLMVMINPSLGFGGVSLYLWRKAQIKWTKLWGIMLFRFLLSIWGICIALIPATLGIQLYWAKEYSIIYFYVWYAILFIMFFWMIETWVFWQRKKYSGLNKLIIRNPESDLWIAFRKSTRNQWILTWIMGITPFMLYLIGIYFLSLAFEVNIPFLKFMVLSPIAMVIADIPFSFAGFGTTTMAFITFFGNYGSPESIAALTLFFPFARTAVRALIGLISIRYASQDINSLLKKSTTKIN